MLKNIWFYISLALFIRIIALIFSAETLYEHNDSYLHRDWGRATFLNGFDASYSKEFISDVGAVNNLPPLATYIFGLMYWLHIQAAKLIMFVLQREPGTFLWMNDGTFANFFMRLPAIISDLIIGFLIFKNSLKFSKNALFYASLYLFNPIVVYSSAVWGQIDSIPVLFFILALNFFIVQKYFLSSFFVFLSLFTKLSLLPLIPIYFLLYLKAVRVKNIAIYFVSILTLSLIFILPISLQPIEWLIIFIQKNSTNVLNNITANAYNFWWLVIAPKLFVPAITVSEKFINISLGAWGYILFTVFIFPLVLYVLKIKNKLIHNPKFIFEIFSLISILYFLFLPSMHERYLFTFIVLMLMFVSVSEIYKKVYYILSLIFIINVISVWQYRIPEKIIRSNIILTNELFSWILSLIVTFAGIYLYYRFFKYRIKEYSKN